MSITETVPAATATQAAASSSSSTNGLDAPILVIGSPASARDGSYQRLITDIEQTKSAEKLMIDRLLEGGTFSFPRSHFETVDTSLTAALHSHSDHSPAFHVWPCRRPYIP